MIHNHVTRDIKPKGQCPACDKMMALQAANRVIANFLYEHNFDHEEADAEAKKLIKQLAEIGLTVTWLK